MRYVSNGIAMALALALFASAAGASGPPSAPLSKCPADAVVSGPVCMDKYEASVWRVPNATTANKSLVARIRRGMATAAELGTRLSVPGGSYTSVTAPALKKMLESKDFVFVNVHVPYEGEIARTDDFIPFDKVEQRRHLLPANKDAKVVLYCMSDRMSNIAAETLVRLGYTNVWNLVGGMVDWRQRGYPLISGPAK